MKYFAAIGALSLPFFLAMSGFIPNDALAAGGSYGLQGNKITKIDKR